jgi:hypothetical protein
VVLQIENRTKQILTLRSCALSTAEAGPRWQIPPPSGVESEAIACFGATTTSAAEVGGRFTLVDAARHCYHLEFGTSSGGGIGSGSARGKVTLEAVSTVLIFCFAPDLLLCVLLRLLGGSAARAIYPDVLQSLVAVGTTWPRRQPWCTAAAHLASRHNSRRHT